jgi:hypothetical protein
MTIKPNILIIGSTGRNTGKTEFACRVIERLSTQKELVGIKVVPVDKDEGKCHKGLDGCGLCDSLTEDFKIIEELATDTSKDTSRMLKAGAKKVFLLLVERNSMRKGLEALLDLIPDRMWVVIESNSIRNVVEPGLFLVIKKTGDQIVKQTCAGVIERADKIIEFHDMTWDYPPDNILIQNERWIMKE